jgi:hypothetical protein
LFQCAACCPEVTGLGEKNNDQPQLNKLIQKATAGWFLGAWQLYKDNIDLIIGQLDGVKLWYAG